LSSRSPKRSHTLRYVLRNRKTEQIYAVVVFSLYLKEDVLEDGSIKPEALKAAMIPDEAAEEDGAAAAAKKKAEDDFDHDAALDVARKTLSQEHLDKPPAMPETSPDDVD
jgi:hypothetical protein